MKIVCSKSELLKGLNIASKAVPNKTTMDTLECIIFDCNEGMIKLIANDMDLGIETIIPGTIYEKGVIAIDSSIIINIVRSFPDSEITIDCDYDYKTVISCENSMFNIVAKNTDSFTYLPKYEKSNPIIISKITLKDAIRKTIFSINEKDSNKVMSGELFEITGNNLRVVALDGHRISINNIKLNALYEDKSIIIPGRTLNELTKIIDNEEGDLFIYICDKHIIFEYDDTTVVSRLIEGKYFDINKMLTDNYDTKITINKKSLIDSINRGLLLINDGNKKPIIMKVNEENIEIGLNSPLGSLNDVIDISREGINQIIGFNPKFMVDALRVIDDEEINIYLMNAKSPAFIRDEDNTYIYLVLPVNFNSI